MTKIKFSLNSQTVEIEGGTSLQEIINQDYKTKSTKIIVAKSNFRVVELTYCPQQDDVVTTLTIASSEGSRVYIRGLIHIFVRACYSVLPSCNVYIQNSIANGLYCDIQNAKVDPFVVDKIGKKMREYVNQDEAFIKSLTSKQQAIDFYKANKQADKAQLLSFREDKQFKLYTCGNLSDYYYGHMPPSTGYIDSFRLFFDNAGIILAYPDFKDLEKEIVLPINHKLAFVFAQSKRWADILGCSTVSELNQLIEKGNLRDLILANEAFHEKAIASFADEICENGSRLVLIAGPSSSGKTTFAQRLRIQLKVNEKTPVLLSLDNYYVDRDKIQKRPDGTVDLEDIGTIDTELFNEHMHKILEGEAVEVPRFNFEKAKREPTGKMLALPKNGVLIVEGIHGLNPALGANVPRTQKFKIYISALTQLSLDHHNRIPTTDSRLIRRLVRDYSHRASSAENTLSMWPSVVAGEEKWIFPYQENCDRMFNSTLLYELLFLKKRAIKLLSTIPLESECFSEANRMIKFLNYFCDADVKSEIDVSCISILREFIGGGVFEQ